MRNVCKCFMFCLKFKDAYIKRNIQITEADYQAIIKEVDDAIRKGAWEAMLEHDRHDEEFNEESQ